jgi:hypothetical protein
VADQFQLLISTHIFVSMICSAVCNALCALNDSALEALVRKAVSAQTKPLEKVLKTSAVVPLSWRFLLYIGLAWLGLGLMCCRASLHGQELLRSVTEYDVSDFHAGVVRRHSPLTVRLGPR